MTCKPLISFSEWFFQFLNSLLRFILACKLAKAFLVPLIFWKTFFPMIVMLLITSLIHLAILKLGNFQENFALSLDTEAFYPCLQVTSYKPLLEVSRCSLNSFCKVSSCLDSRFASFGHFRFPLPLGSIGIPELGFLLLEAESHSGHCFHNLKIFRLCRRGGSRKRWFRNASGAPQGDAPEMLTPCSPPHILVTETTHSPAFGPVGGISWRKLPFLSEFKLPLSQHSPKRSPCASSQG